LCRAGPLQATATVSTPGGEGRKGYNLRTTGRGLSSPPRRQKVAVCVDLEAIFAGVSRDWFDTMTCLNCFALFCVVNRLVFGAQLLSLLLWSRLIAMSMSFYVDDRCLDVKGERRS
jgi:hypothetical protein